MDSEETIMVNRYSLFYFITRRITKNIHIQSRVLRDDPSKSDMHNREGLSIRMLWKALSDWHLWPLYAVALTFGGIELYLSF